MKRLPALASFILFIALCASIAYWAMQLFKPQARPVAAPPPAAQPAPNIDAAAGLFGGRSSVAVASNYQLRGVVVSGNADESVAILATEGKPAQAIRANMEIAPGVKVQEVHRGYVVLSEHGVPKRVELPQESKSQAGADPAGRPPVPNRATPNQQQPSAADARRSAIFNQPSPPPAQTAPPPAQSPPAEPGAAATGSSGTAGVGSTGRLPAGGSAPPPVAPAAQQAVPHAATSASPQPATQPSSAAPQLVPQQR